MSRLSYLLRARGGLGCLLPSSITEPPGIHLSHITHADDTDDEAFHLWRYIRHCVARGHSQVDFYKRID